MSRKPVPSLFLGQELAGSTPAPTASIIRFALADAFLVAWSPLMRNSTMPVLSRFAQAPWDQ